MEEACRACIRSWVSLCLSGAGRLFGAVCQIAVSTAIKCAAPHTHSVHIKCMDSSVRACKCAPRDRFTQPLMRMSPYARRRMAKLGGAVPKAKPCKPDIQDEMQGRTGADAGFRWSYRAALIEARRCKLVLPSEGAVSTAPSAFSSFLHAPVFPRLQCAHIHVISLHRQNGKYDPCAENESEVAAALGLPWDLRGPQTTDPDAPETWKGQKKRPSGR